MQRLRTTMLALVAVLAVGAVSVASASAALPEWSAGSVGVTFTGTGGAGMLETLGKRQIKCTSNSASGEISGAKAVKNVTVTFKGCKTKIPLFGEEPCKSVSPAGGAEEIKTNTLSGEIGYISEPVAKTVGQLLKPTTAALFTEIKCEGIFNETLKVRHEVIGQIRKENSAKEAQYNNARTKIEIVFAQAGGKQKPETFEGSTEKHILETEGSGAETFAFEQSGVEGTDNLTAGKAIELKA